MTQTIPDSLVEIDQKWEALIDRQTFGELYIHTYDICISIIWKFLNIIYSNLNVNDLIFISTLTTKVAHHSEISDNTNQFPIQFAI